MKVPVSIVLLLFLVHNAYQQAFNCYVPADIIILIDGSDSIKDQNWIEIKNFVNRLVTNFDIGPDAIHVGYIVYSSDVGDRIGLAPFKPKYALQTFSDNLRHPKASTNTARGIEEARDEFRTRGRPGVPKILIVITDGSSDNPKETRMQADMAKREGVRVIAVGIGQTFRDELRQIASKPEKVYTAASFATLQTLVFEIRRMVCQVITTTTTTTTAIPIPTKPPVVIPVPSDKICNVPGDIVFVMDGSDSIEDADFVRQKLFVANLIDNFEISSDAIHVGLVVYSTLIGDTVGLQPPKSKELLKILARNLRHPKVGTNTALGIARAREMIKNEGRPMAPKIIVVITDGRSSSPKQTVAQASMGKVEGITMVAVGVGTQIFSDELRQIATSIRKVFEVSDFRSLELIINSMRDMLCQAITTTTSTTTTTQKPTYIPPPPDLFCQVPADIGILLDGSDSIANADWVKQKSFVASLINNLDVGRDTIHVGVVVFSTIIGETVGLTPFKAKELLMIMSNNLKQPKVGTNTALGIQRMREMLRDQGRENAPKVMIIVTDGKSSSPKKTIAQANLAKQDGITVIAVGVGLQLFREELRQIATNERKLFEVSDFQALQQIIVALRDLICQVITTTTTTELVTTPMPPVTLPPYVGCDIPADIMFMMHGAADIKEQNWSRNQRFVSGLVRNLYVSRPAHRIGVVVYSRSVGDHVGLSPYKDSFNLQNMINGLTHPRDGANTAAAIARVIESFRKYGRSGAPRVAVLVTDQQSTTPSETRAQAELAQKDNIKMITVGVGSRVNMGELGNLATDSKKVFQADDFSRLDNIMPRVRDMICETIMKPPSTLPPPVSTPTPDFTQLCAGCLMNSNSGFNPYPGDCTKYVQCWRDNSRIMGAIKDCPYGQFWDEDAITCRPSMNVMCPQDPCINAPNGFTHGMPKHGCRSHWVCVKGFSVASCCPEGTYYLEGMGCMRGMACKTPCPPDGGLIISPNCEKEAHWDRRFYMEMVPNKGKVVRRCAPGTIFDKGYCTCVIATSNYVPVTPEDKCSESIHLNFDVNMKDKSGKRTQIINSGGVRRTRYGAAKFDGKSHLGVWNLGNIDYTNKFALKFKFKFDRWENRFDAGGFPVDAGWNGDFLWKWDSQVGWVRNSTVGGGWNVVTLMNMFKRLFAATSENEMETIMVEIAKSPDFQILLYHIGFQPESTNAIQILRQLVSGNGAIFIRQILNQVGNMQDGAKMRQLLIKLLNIREIVEWITDRSGQHVDITLQRWRQFLSSLGVTDSGWDINGRWDNNNGMDDRTFDIIADLWYQFVRENGMTGPEWEGILTWALGGDRMKGSLDKRWIIDILMATKDNGVKTQWLDYLNKRNISINWINMEWQIGGGGNGGSVIGGNGGMNQGQWTAWLNWLAATYGSGIGGTGTGSNIDGQSGFYFDSFFHWLLGSGSYGFDTSGGTGGSWWTGSGGVGGNGNNGNNWITGNGWLWGGQNGGQGIDGSGTGHNAGGWFWGSSGGNGQQQGEIGGIGGSLAGGNGGWFFGGGTGTDGQNNHWAHESVNIGGHGSQGAGSSNGGWFNGDFAGGNSWLQGGRNIGGDGSQGGGTGVGGGYRTIWGDHKGGWFNSGVAGGNAHGHVDGVGSQWGGTGSLGNNGATLGGSDGAWLNSGVAGGNVQGHVDGVGFQWGGTGNHGNTGATLGGSEGAWFNNGHAGGKVQSNVDGGGSYWVGTGGHGNTGASVGGSEGGWLDGGVAGVNLRGNAGGDGSNRGGTGGHSKTGASSGDSKGGSINNGDVGRNVNGNIDGSIWGGTGGHGNTGASVGGSEGGWLNGGVAGVNLRGNVGGDGSNRGGTGGHSKTGASSGDSKGGFINNGDVGRNVNGNIDGSKWGGTGGHGNTGASVGGSEAGWSNGGVAGVNVRGNVGGDRSKWGGTGGHGNTGTTLKGNEDGWLNKGITIENGRGNGWSQGSVDNNGVWSQVTGAGGAIEEVKGGWFNGGYAVGNGLSKGGMNTESESSQGSGVGGSAFGSRTGGRFEGGNGQGYDWSQAGMDIASGGSHKAGTVSSSHTGAIWRGNKSNWLNNSITGGRWLKNSLLQEGMDTNSEGPRGVGAGIAGGVSGDNSGTLFDSGITGVNRQKSGMSLAGMNNGGAVSKGGEIIIDHGVLERLNSNSVNSGVAGGNGQKYDWSQRNKDIIGDGSRMGGIGVRVNTGTVFEGSYGDWLNVGVTKGNGQDIALSQGGINKNRVGFQATGTGAESGVAGLRKGDLFSVGANEIGQNYDWSQKDVNFHGDGNHYDRRNNVDTNGAFWDGIKGVNEGVTGIKMQTTGGLQGNINNAGDGSKWSKTGSDGRTSIMQGGDKSDLFSSGFAERSWQGIDSSQGGQGWGFGLDGTGYGSGSSGGGNYGNGGNSGGSSGGSSSGSSGGSSESAEVGTVDTILNNLEGVVGTGYGSSSQESGEVQIGQNGMSSSGGSSQGSAESRRRGPWGRNSGQFGVAFPGELDMPDFPDFSRKKRAAPTGDIFQYQTLLTNCQPSGQNASVMVTANERNIRFGMKTEGRNKMAEMEFNLVPGWNEVTMMYDGTNLKCKVQNWRGVQENSIPLTGNIEKRQGFRIGGACGANAHFKGQMDDILLYNCLPAKFR